MVISVKEETEVMNLVFYVTEELLKCVCVHYLRTEFQCIILIGNLFYHGFQNTFFYYKNLSLEFLWESLA
jgi:hypothetical protein